ncbi:serine hydrolase domain-containing protein [Rheinheimera baltica]|uniref:serine hydrolase domain-containing protein n=1 Tax=Rheinheimera baltica TaxID=67576 RepID=UPI00273FE0FB|nr:serine hydrolase domain-containing protein [Rheinheimera baltica]MDP5149571.1 serine hydrolase [Rheinheimera baltica]
MKNKILTAMTLLGGIVSSALFANPVPLDFNQLTTQLETKFADLNVPGAQVAVFDDKNILWQNHFGFADSAKQTPVSDNTLFRAGSTTKTFVGLAIMQLVNQGKFTLQDDVLQLEPRLLINNAWQNTDPVRVIHLLEHTAGLDDMHFRNFYNVSEPDITILDAVNRDAASLRVRWQPGSRHAYSNPGYGILGHLIELYSGQSFEHYITEHVLLPLGITQCHLNSSNIPEADLSAGFVDGEAVAFRQIYLRSAGNLHCTAAGLAQLGSWLLSRGQTDSVPYVNPQTIQQMEQPESTLAAKQGLAYGYAKAIYHATRNGREWLGHNGGIDGFLTSYAYNRDLNLGYAVMINSSSASMRQIVDTITQLLAQNAPLPDATLLPIDLENLDGYYRVSNERNQIFAGISFSTAVAKLTTSGSTLVVAPLLGDASEYVYLGQGQFAKAGEGFAKVSVIGNTVEGFAIDLDGDYLIKTSFLSAWLPLIMLGFIFSVFLLTLCYAPVWCINALRGKLTSRQQLWLRLMPLLTVLCLVAVISALFNLSLFETAYINWQTLTIYIGSLAFAISSAIALWLVMRALKTESSCFARYFTVVSVISANFLAVYCYHFDYLGLALWQW